MKRFVVVLLLASLGTACGTLHKGGTRGPQIGRTTTADQPAHVDDAAQRELDLGQR